MKERDLKAATNRSICGNFVCNVGFYRKFGWRLDCRGYFRNNPIGARSGLGGVSGYVLPLTWPCRFYAVYSLPDRQLMAYRRW